MDQAASLFASFWLTYLLRAVVAFAIFWLTCRFIRDPHLRFQLCGVFLGGMVMAWFGLLVRPGLPALSVSGSAASTSVSAFSWLWTLHLALAPRAAIVLSRAWAAYVAILALLLLRFGAAFWKLWTALCASQPPPEALSALFESVRSGTRASRCELWLVPDLRSPTATGWWRPKVLLPHDFMPRLETQQLVDVLRHELMHVAGAIIYGTGWPHSAVMCLSSGKLALGQVKGRIGLVGRPVSAGSSGANVGVGLTRGLAMRVLPAKAGCIITFKT